MADIKLIGPKDEERKTSALDSIYGPGYQDMMREKVYPDLFGAQNEFAIGLGDEISAYTQAPIDYLYGLITGNPQDFSAIVEERRGLSTEAQQAYRDAHPVLSTLANVGGGTLALPARAASTVMNVGGRLLEGAKAGSVGGAIAGAAEGEGVEGRLEGGVVGAGIGAVLGAVIPGGAELVARTAAGLRNIAGLKGQGAIDRAQQMLLQALERDGISLADLQARAQSGKPLTIADLANASNTRALLGSASRRGGEAMADVEDFLTTRSKEAFGRLEDDIGRGLGDPNALRATDQALIAEKAKASPLYDALKGSTTEMDDELKSVLMRPAGRRAFAKARQWWANKGRAMPEDGSIPFEVLDQTKKEMDALAKYASTPQGGAEIGGVGAIRDMTAEFRDILDDRFPGYAAARKQSADPQQIRDALEAGRAFGREDSADLAADFANLSIPEQDAFRLGAARAIRNKIGKKSFTANTAKEFDNPVIQEQLKAMFPDIDTFRTFMQAVADENTMQETFDHVLRNSATARRAVADEEFSQGAAGLGDAAVDLLRGKGMTMTALDWAARVGTGARDRVAYGLNQRVGGEIGKLATSTDLPGVARTLSRTRPIGVPARLMPRGSVARPAAVGGVAVGERLTSPGGEGRGPRNTAPNQIKVLEVAPPEKKTSDASMDGVSPDAQRTLAALQRRWGRDLPVTSAFRDKAHNTRVGGAKKSRHMKGDAFDIDVSGLSLPERLRLLNTASETGFTGIGVYNNSIHLDMGPRRAWGPSRKSESVPGWAAPVVARHMGREG